MGQTVGSLATSARAIHNVTVVTVTLPVITNVVLTVGDPSGLMCPLRLNVSINRVKYPVLLVEGFLVAQTGPADCYARAVGGPTAVPAVTRHVLSRDLSPS